MIHAIRLNVDSAIVKILIDSGVDINSVDSNGKTALIYAIENDSQYEIVKMLIDAGADVKLRNRKGRTAFYYLHNRMLLYNTEAYSYLENKRYEI